MNEPSKITIKTEGISNEEKNTEKFQSAYREMLAELSAPGFIPVLCAHEATHLIYLTMAGMKKFDALPPTITFDPAKNDYTGHFAAIKALDMPSWTPGKFHEWFSYIARAYVAPGVVARKLMPSSVGGDSKDKERFKKVCDDINKADPNAKIDFDWWWSHGEEMTIEDLKNPNAMKSILEQAENLRPQFGL